MATTVSVDGRVTTSRQERLLDPAVSARWQSVWPSDTDELTQRRRQWIETTWAPTIVLEGSGTFVADDAESRWVDAEVEVIPDDLFEDFIPTRSPRWFAVVDGRGRVDWQFTRDGDTALLVLVCTATPPAYLMQLRDLRVAYLVVGTEHVDLTQALTRMADEFDAQVVVSEGGGGINGALLRAGLVDEVHVITFPALVGGLGTPSSFDGPALQPAQVPIALICEGVEQGTGGSMWTRYVVSGTGVAPRYRADGESGSSGHVG